MNKLRHGKKLSLSTETLRQLDSDELQKANGHIGNVNPNQPAGGNAFPTFASNCPVTCGANSCLGACTANCSWFCGPTQA